MLTCSFQGEQVQDLNLKFTPQHSYHIIRSYLHLQGSISRWSTSGCPCFSLHSSICLKGIVNSHILSLIFYLFFFFFPLQPSARDRLLSGILKGCSWRWPADLLPWELHSKDSISPSRTQGHVQQFPTPPLPTRQKFALCFRNLAGTSEGCALNNKSEAAPPASGV